MDLLRLNIIETLVVCYGHRKRKLKLAKFLTTYLLVTVVSIAKNLDNNKLKQIKMPVYYNSLKNKT